MLWPGSYVPPNKPPSKLIDVPLPAPSFLTTISSDRYAVNATTYRYYYAGNFTNISPRPWEGAYHSSELPLIFGTHSLFRGESTPFEYAVSYRYQDLYLAFANDPANGLAAQGWPAYKPNGSVLKIGDDGLVTQLMDVKILQDLCVGLDPVPGAIVPK